MVNIQALGGRGTGVNPEGSDYPFVDPQDDVRGLLADAFLAHEVQAVKLPLRIVWIRGLGEGFGSAYASESSASDFTDHDVDVVIKDANDATIFDSREADSYRQTDFGTRLRIHEWTQVDTSVCRIVQHTQFEDAEDVYSIPYIISPTNGVLDERVSQLLPRRVTSLTANFTTIRENIQLVSGYNTVLTPGDDVISVPGQGLPSQTIPRITPTLGQVSILRPRQKLTLSAHAGSGLGAFPGCDDETIYIERINAVPPDPDGDFLLSAGECYFVRQPTTVLSDSTTRATPATLKIGNDCGPCCECVEFAHTYKGVRRLWDKFNILGDTAEDVRDLFRINLRRWSDQKECREASPLRLASAVTTVGQTLYVDISGAICNTTKACLLDLDLTIGFEWICPDVSSSSFAPGSAVGELGEFPDCDVYSHPRKPPDVGPEECNTSVTRTRYTTRQPYKPEGSWPCYKFHWDEVDSGRSVNFKTRMEWKNCKAQLDQCDYLTITMYGSISNTVLSQVPVRQHVIDCDGCDSGADADSPEAS
jgi:hypothetical protein